MTLDPNAREPDHALSSSSLPADREAWRQIEQQLKVPRESMAIVIVDHGSRVDTSNELLLEFVAMFARYAPVPIVEGAHMELAEPSIRTAIERCVARGARAVFVSPFFLLPGKHWQRDLPRLIAEATEPYPNLPWMLAAPLGLHPLLPEVLLQRIEQCALHSRGLRADCDMCHREGGQCGFA